MRGTDLRDSHTRGQTICLGCLPMWFDWRYFYLSRRQYNVRSWDCVLQIIWQSEDGDVGGSRSEVTKAWAFATFLVKMTWRSDDSVLLDLPPKISTIRFFPRYDMSSWDLFWGMTALAQDFMTGSDFTNFWNADFSPMPKILEVESHPE